jgi:hypothetical protein
VLSARVLNLPPCGGGRREAAGGGNAKHLRNAGDRGRREAAVAFLSRDRFPIIGDSGLYQALRITTIKSATSKLALRAYFAFFALQP